MAFYFNKLEFPSSEDALCMPTWVEYLNLDLFKFKFISLLSPYGKGCGPKFKQT